MLGNIRFGGLFFCIIVDSERVGFDRLTGRYYFVFVDDVFGRGTYWGGFWDKFGYRGGGLGVLSGVYFVRGGFVDY